MYSPQVDEMPMPEIWYSPVFGMGFWINDIGLLMSAPAFCTAGDYDMDNAIPVSDWENWEEINTPENLSCLADIVQVCTLKRDFANIGYIQGSLVQLDNWHTRGCITVQSRLLF